MVTYPRATTPGSEGSRAPIRPDCCRWCGIQSGCRQQLVLADGGDLGLRLLAAAEPAPAMPDVSDDMLHPENAPASAAARAHPVMPTMVLRVDCVTTPLSEHCPVARGPLFPTPSSLVAQLAIGPANRL